MKLRVRGTIEITPWILGWGSLVEVVSPAGLREEVAANLRKAALIYDS